MKKFDIVFPVLHGLNGEDGTIQGMLEILDVPYIGCKVLSSSICMDKIYSKIIFEKCNIKQSKYIYLQYLSKNKFMYFSQTFDSKILNLSELNSLVEKNISYPLFVKPSRSGSSIGITKVKNEYDLSKALEIAAKYDTKILIEQAINGKEVEVAILGNINQGIEISSVGEIKPAEDFYSFSSKYENVNSTTKIPANISKSQSDLIQSYAKKLFIAVDCSGLARIDFFVGNTTDDIYINEINTMPGFTNISMYPMLMRYFGYTNSKLIDRLIDLAL